MVRVPFIIQNLEKTGRIKSGDLSGVRILDVGCGVGILSEALAIAGAEVVGIDPSENLLRVAKEHKLKTMKEHPLMNLTYYSELVEDFAAKNKEKFDVVVASEIVEHVPDPEFILKHSIKALKPGGSIFMTTMNRTFRSFICGQVFASWICNIIPRGSHSWFKFMKPEEAETIFNKYNCHKAAETGFLYMVFFTLQRKFIFIKDTSIMYGMHAVKNIDYSK